MKRRALLPFAVAIGALLAACGGQGQEDDPAEGDPVASANGEGGEADWPDRLTMLTPGTGGTWYPGGGAMSELLTSTFDVVVSVESTSGSPENVSLLAEESREFAWLDWATVYKARAGDEYVDSPAENVVALGPVYGGFYHFIVSADSDIDSIEDFKGMRVNTGPPGSGTEFQLEEFLPVLGFSEPPWNDFQQEPLGIGEAVDALRNGQVDVATVNAAPPNSSVQDLATSVDIRVIPFTDEQVSAVTSAFPWYLPIDIPGGSYPGVETDVSTITPPAGVFTITSLPDDLVYEFTKALYGDSGYERLESTVEAFGDVIFEQVNDMPFPLHPGAERYWREVGVLR